MKNLLEYILIRLVENPDDIKVTETVDDDGFILLNITADPADYGRIIGRGGSVITSIRNIIRVRAIKEGKRVAVKVDAENDDRDNGRNNGRDNGRNDDHNNGRNNGRNNDRDNSRNNDRDNSRREDNRRPSDYSSSQEIKVDEGLIAETPLETEIETEEIGEV